MEIHFDLEEIEKLEQFLVNEAIVLCNKKYNGNILKMIAAWRNE